MSKKWVVFALALWACGLSAQGKQNLEGEDLLAAFAQYNPLVLEKAAASQNYAQVLQNLVAHFSVPNTDENQAEMLALVKNFDNSMDLHLLRQQYYQYLLWQRMSGAAEPAEQEIKKQMQPIVTRIHQNTLTVKKWQLKHFKQEKKKLQKSDLSAEQKAAQTAQLNEQIKQVKQTIRDLKKQAKQQIQSTVDNYLLDMKQDFEQEMAAAYQQQAQASKAHDIKADHKKPVAQ